MGFLRVWFRRWLDQERDDGLDLDPEVVRSVQQLAGEEARPEEQVAADLLAQALVQRQAAEQVLVHWHTLTRREQQVAALMCCGLTNEQIAGRLQISPETVKIHSRRVIRKFGVRNRSDLRVALAAWDFRSWVERNL